MKIRKKYQGVLPDNKIVNTESNSQTDTYSCDYINNMTFPGGGGNLDELPVGTVVHFDGEEIPEGWSEIESDDVDVVNTSTVGTILYESTEGSNQNITLSESMSNFEYVDIIYGIATNKFTKRIPCDTNTFTLDRWVVIDGQVYTRMTTYDVVDNVISVKQFALKYDSNKQVITESADASPLAIFKVVGYKQNVGEIIANAKSAISVIYIPETSGRNWELPTSNESHNYPINTISSQTGDGLTLDVENSCITVGKGIHTVLVFTKVTYYSTKSGSDKTWATYITNNLANFSQCTFTARANEFMNINNSVVLSVKEGDQIRMPFYGQQGDQVGRSTNTVMSVIDITNTPTVSIPNDKGEYYFNTFTNEEHLIGQWADGNLLYRKVFVLSGSSGDISIDITDLNTSTPFIDFSHSFIAYTGYRIPLNRYAGSTNWITACINYTSSAQKIEIQFGDTFKTVSKTVVVVLEYTKKSN